MRLKTLTICELQRAGTNVIFEGDFELSVKEKVSYCKIRDVFLSPKALQRTNWISFFLYLFTYTNGIFNFHYLVLPYVNEK